MRYSIDSTNPLIFFGLMAIAIFFIAVSMLSIFLLGFLLIMIFASPGGVNSPQILMVSLLLGMIGIGCWNIVDSARLINEMKIRLLGHIFARSLIALTPIALLLIVSRLI